MSPTGREKAFETQITIRLPVKLKEALEELAAKDRRLLSDYLRLLLEDYVARQKKKRK